jgi:hypothetical protein
MIDLYREKRHGLSPIHRPAARYRFCCPASRNDISQYHFVKSVDSVAFFLKMRNRIYEIGQLASKMDGKK